MIIYKLSAIPYASDCEKTDNLNFFNSDHAKIIPSLPDAPLCVALGSFDGVHLGHAALIKRAIEEKNLIPGAVSAVWTFFPPSKSHEPENFNENPKYFCKSSACLTDLYDRLYLFAKSGLDYAIFEDFDSVRTFSPEKFVDDVLLKLNTAVAICGYNYRFGYKGSGTAELLDNLLSERGKKSVTVPPVMSDGLPISSSAIRNYIEAGNVSEAERLLGRPFSLFFPVIHGNEIGRTIGIPTINQAFPKGRIIPQTGVYICSCHADNKIFPAVSNIGYRPTLNSDRTKINCETHLLDYDGYLYDETVKVCFHKRVRGEIRFPDLESLKRQIESDMHTARQYFSERPELLK